MLFSLSYWIFRASTTIHQFRNKYLHFFTSNYYLLAKIFLDKWICDCDNRNCQANAHLDRNSFLDRNIWLTIKKLHKKWFALNNQRKFAHPNHFWEILHLCEIFLTRIQSKNWKIDGFDIGFFPIYCILLFGF